MRFQKCAIAVNEARPRHSSNVRILPDNSQFTCLATVHELGLVRYVLRMRIISDKPNRVICGYMIETKTEQIRVLEPDEEIPSKFMSWDPGECILNNFIKRPFGPTRFREGLLLGEGFGSPVVDGRKCWATITVAVLDQFDNWYEQALRVFVHDENREVERSVITPQDRKNGGLFAPAEDEATDTWHRSAAGYPNRDSESAINRNRRPVAAPTLNRTTGRTWPNAAERPTQSTASTE